jgi:hypothetical protein
MIRLALSASLVAALIGFGVAPAAAQSARLLKVGVAKHARPR